MNEWQENEALQDNWQTASFPFQTALWLEGVKVWIRLWILPCV